MSRYSRWITPRPVSLPSTHFRTLGDQTYLVSTWGGDESGQGVADDSEILAAVSRYVGSPLRWMRGSEWECTNEASNGDVVRRCEVVW